MIISKTSSLLHRILLVTILTFIAVSARAVIINGVVKDKEGEALMGASVRLLAAADSSLVKGTLSDEIGRFELSSVNPGRYLVQIDYIGFAPEYRKVAVDSADISLGKVVLGEKSHQLAEVTVKAVKTEIRVAEDTVEYNADSYKVQPNAVVQDLLKRLPGVEVGTDGKITANGKEVSKILVDGKEFFSDDPAVASKNLPANMVDKLQVVDRKSDLARLTGVDDGEDETVINLTVKKGMKNGWFGNVLAGYGTDNRYTGSLVANRFWNNNQFTIIGNANNINESGFTDGNGRRFRRFGGDNGINSTQSLGLNFNVGNGEIFRVGGNVMYSHNDRNSRKKQDRTYLLPDSASYHNSGSRSRDRGHNVRADFRVQWNPDSLNTFEFRPRISLNFNRSTSLDSTLISAGDASRTRVSRTINDNHTHGHSFEMSGELVYNHKFASRPGRSFSVDARYELSNVREKGTAYSLSEFFLLADRTDLYDQYSNNHTWANSVRGRLSWTEPLGNPANGNFLTAAYQVSYRWNNADKLVYDATTDVLDDNLSNSFRNDYFNQDLRLGYKRVTKAYNLEAGLSFVPQMSKSIDLINSARNIDERWVWNFAPFLNYRLKMGQRRSLNLRYNGRSSQPTMSQLQPVEDKSDPMRIVVGNPNLVPSFTHTVMARFQDFNIDRQRSIMAMAHVRMVQNSIVSHTTLLQDNTGAQITTYENVNGVWQAMAMGMMSMPLSNKAFQLSVMANMMYNRNVGFNNNRRNVSNDVRIGLSPGISFRPDNMEFELRPNYSLQHTSNTLRSTTRSTVHNYGGTFNGYYYTPIGLTFNTDLTFTGTSGYAAGFNKHEWIWNVELSYQFLRGKAATVALKIYDLLHQKKDITRTVTANYIDDTRYNAVTRYFMLTFAYKFNTMGKKTATRGMSMFGGPDGPPEPPEGGPGNRQGPPGPPPGGMSGRPPF